MKSKIILFVFLLCLSIVKLNASDVVKGYSHHDEIHFKTTKVGEFSFRLRMSPLNHSKDPSLINVFPSVHIYWNGVKQEINWFDAWAGCTVKSPKPLNGNTTVIIETPIYHPLSEFVCNDNEVTELEFRSGLYNGKYISRLECKGNKLEVLNLRNLENLSQLDCSYNNLKELDVSLSPSLKDLNCSNNLLTKLLIKKYSSTGAFALKKIDFSSNQINQIDLQDVKSLEELYCNNNLLTQLNLKEHTKLTRLNCTENKLTTLDVSKSEKLEYLNCANNSLTSLNIKNMKALLTLDCSTNQLTSLDISNVIKLQNLDCNDNQLNKLDLSNNLETRYLNCKNNKLTSLNVKNNVKLGFLWCYNNQLKTLDISNNLKLYSFHCGGNQLTSLDVTKHTGLTLLYCWDNQLTSIDISNNIDLKDFHCGKNQLTSLDISKNKALLSIHCWNNQLTSLDISIHPALTALYCDNNQLTNLDLSNNPNLIYLYCYNNQLAALDLSNNPALTSLNCENNSITLANIFDIAQRNINTLDIGKQNLPNVSAERYTAISVDTVFNGINTTFDIPSANKGEHYVINEGNITFLKAGEYILTLSNPALRGGYTVQNFQVISTIEWEQDLTATYGDAPISLNAISSNNLEITYTSDNENTATIDGNILTVKGAGTATITAKAAVSDSVSISFSKMLQVEKAMLTISADDAKRAYGAENPPFSLSYTGFVNNETKSVLDTLPTISCVANPNSSIGLYDIILHGGSDNNYDYNLINGKLEVFSEPIILSGFTINNGEKISIFPTVDISFIIDAGVPTEYIISEKTNFADAVWQKYNPDNLTYTFVSETSEQKILYAKLKNDKGETAVRKDDIYYKPYYEVNISSFTPNNGVYRTENRIIALNHTLNYGNPTLYSVSENKAEIGKVWFPYEYIPTYTLSEQNGIKEIFFAVSDGKQSSDILSAKISLEESFMSLYPNPVRDILFIDIQNDNNETLVVQINNLGGKLMLSKNFDNSKIELDFSSYPAGIYIVKISCGNKIKVHRIIKQ